MGLRCVAIVSLMKVYHLPPPLKGDTTSSDYSSYDRKHLTLNVGLVQEHWFAPKYALYASPSNDYYTDYGILSGSFHE